MPFSCDVGKTGASAEEFYQTDSSSNVVFDFQLSSASTGSTLVLNATTQPGTTILDYGVFTCASGATPQCGTAPPDQSTYCTTGDECISGNVLSFPLYGGNTPTFFVVFDDPASLRRHMC